MNFYGSRPEPERVISLNIIVKCAAPIAKEAGPEPLVAGEVVFQLEKAGSIKFKPSHTECNIIGPTRRYIRLYFMESAPINSCKKKSRTGAQKLVAALSSGDKIVDIERMDARRTLDGAQCEPESVSRIEIRDSLRDEEYVLSDVECKAVENALKKALAN